MVFETTVLDQKSQILCTGLEVEALGTALSVGVSEEDPIPLHCGTESTESNYASADFPCHLVTKAGRRAAGCGLLTSLD